MQQGDVTVALGERNDSRKPATAGSARALQDMGFMRTSRFDAPFWGVLLTGLVLVGTLGLIGLAAAAQGDGASAPSIVTVDDS